MQAEVLSVGTELLLGQTVNTDTTIVAKALSALGIDLLYAAVVGDNVGRLEKAVYDALDRSDILITTGGLGPTGDDLTKETVAAAAGKKLVLHEQSYQHLLDYFANGGMTENQMKQAMLPEGCSTKSSWNPGSSLLYVCVDQRGKKAADGSCQTVDLFSVRAKEKEEYFRESSWTFCSVRR